MPTPNPTLTPNPTPPPAPAATPTPTPTPTSTSRLPSSVLTQVPPNSTHRPRSAQPPSRPTSTSTSTSRPTSRTITPGPAIPLTTTASAKPQRPKPQSLTSGAILTGAERLLALFDEEREKNDARHRAQLADLETRFQAFRAQAEAEQRRLQASVQELEGKGNGKGKGKGKAKAESSGVLEGPADPRMLEQVDEASARLLRQLALHLAEAQGGRAAAAAEDGEQTQPQVEVPDAFIPAFSQYLAAHSKALLEWVEKCRVLEEERDVLREKNKEKRRKIRELEKKFFVADRKGNQSGSVAYVMPPDSGSDSEHDGEGEGREGGPEGTGERGNRKERDEDRGCVKGKEIEDDGRGEGGSESTGDRAQRKAGDRRETSEANDQSLHQRTDTASATPKRGLESDEQNSAADGANAKRFKADASGATS
ncbi:hypothetical protein LshimejAT787_1103190 [Lyophyllum shimeji]|uniref:Uncharacterized protein n=1 Tax=Lyophyllum shimeji TaxID=47721 RepID=A0A9P3PVG3_LYOSH|nr:hypothetical protein LshimejAT787_1103190 [Lyophyllum shimeji]